MPNFISSIIPDAESLLALEPEELAGVVLEHLNSIHPTEARSLLNINNICVEFGVKGYPHEYYERISQALMEAWVWLEREGLIAPRPGEQTHGWVFITRRGQRLRHAVDLDAFRRANLLPKAILHPIISQKVWSSFLRGEYDTSVFQAFKEVEVAVRTAGGFADIDIGVELMRKAFNKDTGPLRDPSVPDAEREALSHLFAGAIGSYKNPHSHRNVSITNPSEAVELIILASHLLSLVDRAKP